jgi:hypothetical protein
MQDIWFPPNTPNSKVVGMFAEEVDNFVDSKGERRSRTVTVLRHKIPGSHDVSCTLVKDNPDGNSVKREWQRAWEHYEKVRATAPEPQVPLAKRTDTAVRLPRVITDPENGDDDLLIDFR